MQLIFFWSDKLSGVLCPMSRYLLVLCVTISVSVPPEKNCNKGYYFQTEKNRIERDGCKKKHTELKSSRITELLFA